MTPAFVVSGLSKSYPDFALENISLRLERGQVLGLVGANGAGKTTLLRLLMGLAAADGGSTEVIGHRLPEAQVAVKQDAALASEDMRLYRGRSLQWHFDLIRRIYPSWDDSYAGALTKRFDLKLSQKVGGFSHGQRVKALLLLCLARRPSLLLLDEPTTGLDPVARAEVLEALADVLRDERRSVVFSSHNTQDVEQLADRICFLDRGRVLADDDKEHFLDAWRRMLCGGAGNAASALPFVKRLRSSGSQHELVISPWREAVTAELLAQGLTVTRVERMSLEEIFVAIVRFGGTS
jgi:ABC-2 type transport system ATP-binding protein